MVWFHGGAYILGTASQSEFDPMVLAVVGDVIIVNVNYRLGVFGFLTTGGDDEGKGNYGMLDQVLALEWINKNIKAFGGDSSKVTIFGESAGAASVHLHLLSPLSRNLFSQGIMQSGSGLCGWAVELDTEKAIEDAMSVGRNLNCSYQSSKELLTCLRTKTTAELLEVQRQIITQAINVIPFVPIVDGDFLTDKPATLVEHGNFKSANILIGNNKDEGTLWAMRAYPLYVPLPEAPEMLLPEFQEVFPEYVYWYKDPHTTDAIEQQYLDWTKVDDASADHFQSFVEMTTDQTFACPASDVARAHVLKGDNVYRYEMTHVPSKSVYTLSRRLGPKWLGATHGEDLQYMFGWGFNDAFKSRYGNIQNDEEKTMSVQFMKYWANFANYGDPNGVSNLTSTYPSWPKFTVPELEYKELSIEMENGRALRADGCSFWRNYVPRLSAFTGKLSDLEKDWRNSYYSWKYDDMPEWTTNFNDYKNQNECTKP
ncbi:cholinesterase-like [Antedon mediterranea]|uniref:cholinesterase-like n=1 Tax=Antedon mediterranea TaxID=105859 RepID=UPI003AF47CF1